MNMFINIFHRSIQKDWEESSYNNNLLVPSYKMTTYWFFPQRIYRENAYEIDKGSKIMYVWSKYTNPYRVVNKDKTSLNFFIRNEDFILQSIPPVIPTSNSRALASLQASKSPVNDWCRISLWSNRVCHEMEQISEKLT